MALILNAQNVGIGTNNPDNSAMLEVESSNKGILIPRMDSTAMLSILNPATGLLVIDTSNLQLMIFDGLAWIPVDKALGFIPPSSPGNNGDVLVFQSPNITSWQDAKDTLDEIVWANIDSDDLFIQPNQFPSPFMDSTQFNTGIGIQSSGNLTKGQQNTAVGFATNGQLTTGNENTAVGYRSLAINQGSYNTGVGSQALEDQINAEYNVGVGYFAGANFSSGSYNVAIGSGADNGNSQGSRNTVIGHLAGFASGLQSRDGCVYLGYEAGYASDTTNNKLYINNANSATPLIWGDFANDSVKIHGTLSIGNEYAFPLFDGTNDQVLCTDGNGQLNWQNKTGVDSLKNLKDILYDNDQNLIINSIGAPSLIFPGQDNTCIGDLSGVSLTTGAANTAVGTLALNASSTGSYNSAFGDGALASNNSFNNTAIGRSALYQSTSGSQNVAIGSSAMCVDSTGVENVAIGTVVLGGSTSSSQNVVIGDYAASWLRKLNNSVMIGHRAGYDLPYDSQEGCVFIGHNVGQSDSTDNKLYIDNSSTTTPLIWGDFANDSVKIHGTLSIGNEYAFPLLDGTNNQVLCTDGNGQLNWQDKSTSVDSLKNLDDVYVDSSNIFLNDVGAPLINSNGQGNSALGINAGQNITDGLANVMIGQSAMQQSYSGRYNCAIGPLALYENEGRDNVALGYNAMLNSTSGNYNIAIGSGTMAFDTSGAQNVAIGNDAMLSSLKSSQSVVIGNDAGLQCEELNKSVFIGSRTGYFGNYGSQNGCVFIGYGAGSFDTTDNRLYITNEEGSNPLIYGEFDKDSLVVNGDFTINVNGSNEFFQVTEESSEPALRPNVPNWGYVGTESNYLYRLYANEYFALSSSNYSTFSDRRIKKEISSLNHADLVLQLNPVQYKLDAENELLHIDSKSNNTEEFTAGFIAQEVEEIIPHLVKTSDKSGLKSVSYVGMIPYMVETIQNQEKEIEDLRSELDEIKTMLKALAIKSEKKD